MIESTIIFGTWLLSKVADKGFDTLIEKITKSDDLNSQFASAVRTTSNILQLKYPDVLGGSIDYFFKDEEVFNELFKLLFKSSTVNIEQIESAFDVTTLPAKFIQEFVYELRKELRKNRMFDEILSNNELYVVIHGMGSDISKIATSSEISAKQLTLLAENVNERIGNAFDPETFIQHYKSNALNNLSQVNFIGLGIDISIKKNRKNLQDIFVKPYFEVTDGPMLASAEFDEDGIEYKNILLVDKKLVVLGNPGSGKSVLVKSLICDIFSKSDNIDCRFHQYLPFRIELRKYLVQKKEHSKTLLKYLSFVLEQDYQINNVTDKILDNLLRSHKCVLFFDGLDEIFDISDKIDIKNDIENFHNAYDNLRSITTSRIIGYEEASLNDTFTTLHIQNFNNEQISEYLNKWYTKEEENEEIRTKEINGFQSKRHEVDREIIENPLLLSLIVIIYRNILKLPESKLEIYQSCTKTLVDKWDASKELKYDLDNRLYKEKDKLFSDLAYWQYGHLSGKSIKITYDKAKRKIADSLIKLNIADDFDAEDLANNFLTYAQKRSIYFEDNFTHKTFLEYYTAYWIYSNIEKKHKVEERDEILTKYGTNPFWFIVLELLLNLIDNDQADNDIIDDIVELNLKNVKALPFLLSVIFKLKNISISEINKTIDLSIVHIVENNVHEHNVARVTKVERIEQKIYSALEHVYYFNERGRDTIVSRLIEYENQYCSERSFDLLERLYILYVEMLLLKGKTTGRFELSNVQYYKRCLQNNEYLFIIDQYVFPDDRIKATINLIDLFGQESVFKERISTYEGFRIGKYVTTLVFSLTNVNNLPNLSSILIKLESSGLRIDAILDHLLNARIRYSLGYDHILRILSTLDTSEDELVNKFLLFVLGTDRSFGRAKRWVPLIENHSKKEVLAQISNALKFKKAVTAKYPNNRGLRI